MSKEAVCSGAARGVAAVAWPVAIAGVLFLLWQAYFAAPSAQIEVSGPRIEDIRQIASLAVLRVQVANVIEGRTRGARALVLVKGDADIAVDFDQVSVADRDDDARTATVVLGTPRPERPRVDHERTRIYEIQKTGLAALNPLADPRKALLEDCMRAAQAAVEKAVADERYIVQAKEQAESLVQTFYAKLGWDVHVRWQ